MTQYGYSAAVRPRPKNICFIGDSITASTDGLGGYRRQMLGLLSASGRNVIAVGNQTIGGGNAGAHKGYPGISVSLFAPGASSAVPSTWASEFSLWGVPSHCFIYLGANGLEASLAVADVVTPLLAADSNLKVIWGLLFPAVGEDTATFNATLTTAIQAVGSYGTRVFLATSTATALSLSDLGDGLHPGSTLAYSKMAQAFFGDMEAQGILP